jgi:hypothetical protein
MYAQHTPSLQPSPSSSTPLSPPQTLPSHSFLIKPSFSKRPLPTISSHLHQTLTNSHQLLIQFYKPKTIITYPLLAPRKFRTFPCTQYILHTTYKPNQYLLLEPFPNNTFTYSLYLKTTRFPLKPQNETSLKKLDTDFSLYNPSHPNKPPYTIPITYLLKQFFINLNLPLITYLLNFYTTYPHIIQNNIHPILSNPGMLFHSS